MLRFLSAGESHGKALVGILEGFPQGLKISLPQINQELGRRQQGLGRGGRMRIEKDRVEFLCGLRQGITLGSPLGFVVKNKDAKISAFLRDNLKKLFVPRPAHADLAGLLKYQQKDINNILERASARETAVRVVAGALCKQLLAPLGVEIGSFIREFGPLKVKNIPASLRALKKQLGPNSFGWPEKESLGKLKDLIDTAAKNGDTIGGVIEIRVEGLMAGLGSFMQWDRRLDAQLSFALMSIPAVKGVEVGLGFNYARSFGKDAHDAIYYRKKKGFFHLTNNSGGIEGGVSNGEPIVLRIAMKPIATLARGLDSVNVISKKKQKAPSIRSDVAAVYACSVVAEAMTAFIIASSLREKFPADSFKELVSAYRSHRRQIKNY